MYNFKYLCEGIKIWKITSICIQFFSCIYVKENYSKQFNISMIPFVLHCKIRVGSYELIFSLRVLDHHASDDGLSVRYIT